MAIFINIVFKLHSCNCFCKSKILVTWVIPCQNLPLVSWENKFSDDLGHIASPLCISVSSHVTLWPIIDTLFYAHAQVRCLFSGTSGVWHHSESTGIYNYSLSCIFISSLTQLLPSAIDTGVCLEHMFSRCHYSFLLIFFLSCWLLAFLKQVVNSYSLHFLTFYLLLHPVFWLLPHCSVQAILCLCLRGLMEIFGDVDHQVTL